MPGARVGLGTAAYEAKILPSELPRPVAQLCRKENVYL